MINERGVYLHQVDTSLVQLVWMRDLWSHVNQGHVLTLSGNDYRYE